MAPSNDFRDRYGPWAIVAGAGEGLGAAYATTLADRGLHLLLIDARAELLDALVSRLRRDNESEVVPLLLDLAEADAMERIALATEGKEVGLLVYNAAFSMIGPYLDATAEDHRRTLAVNCLTPALLVHHFGRLMRNRGRGGIVLMSSLAGFHGNPFLAHYAATKAYNRVLAEGLWDEYRADGVAVLACCPGATLTPGYLATRPPKSGFASPPETTPEQVVAEALAALGRRPYVIPGRSNRLAAFFMQRILSRPRVVGIMGRIGRRLHAQRKS